MKTARIWVLIQGRVFQPTTCQLVPPPPPPHLQGMASIDEMFDYKVPDGTAYGPMTHAEALDLSSGITKYSMTLCIIPNSGLQAAMLEGLAWHKAKEALDSDEPGVVFLPWSFDNCISDGVTRILMIGYGDPFSDICTEDATASCTSTIAFPLGRTWERPVRHGRGRYPRDSSEWMPPDMVTLEDIKPVAEFLRGLNLTEKDRADFRAAEIVREAKDRQKTQEVDALWAARREAGESMPIGGGAWGLKSDWQEKTTGRILLS